MSAVTAGLHEAFLAALAGRVVTHTDLDRKPLCVDLALPLPPRLRIYMYSLVEGGPGRPFEYKVIVRVPGQEAGKYGSFDHSGNRLAVLMAYRADLDVFVLWDASLHARVMYAGNVQVREEVVHRAAACGRDDQDRRLASGVIERIIACQSRTLGQALADRVGWTGGSR